VAPWLAAAARLETLEHDPENASLSGDAGWAAVLPCDKREAFARRSCSNKKIERADDSEKKSSRSRKGKARSRFQRGLSKFLRR
jgi:hypothetical protein